MNIDVIITTYNRPEIVFSFCISLLNNYRINNLIVVDSSDTPNDKLINHGEIKYVKSKHKSQPYQRYLGSKYVTSDIVVFFDDDLKITDDAIFKDILQVFNDNPDVVGCGVGIIAELGISLSLNETHKKENPLVVSLKKYFSNEPGVISKLNSKTNLPESNTYIEYLFGGIMCFRSRILDELFDETLFALFEYKLAMGEDKVISMRARKFGKLFFLGEKKYLFHPPEPSTYFNDNISFYSKYFYSRLWIANEHNKIESTHFLSFYYFILIIRPLFSRIPLKIKMKAYYKFISYIYKYGLVPEKNKITSTNYYL